MPAQFIKEFMWFITHKTLIKVIGEILLYTVSHLDLITLPIDIMCLQLKINLSADLWVIIFSFSLLLQYDNHLFRKTFFLQAF